MAVLLAMGGCVLPELDVGEPPTDAEECRSCAEEQCTERFDACMADSACEKLVECALACPPDDDQCPLDCANENPDGASLALDLFECTDQQCADPCPSAAI